MTEWQGNGLQTRFIPVRIWSAPYAGGPAERRQPAIISSAASCQHWWARSGEAPRVLPEAYTRVRVEELRKGGRADECTSLEN